MVPFHILTSGRFGKEFQQWINATYTDLQCTYAATDTEALELLPEVNAIAGFNFLHPTDLSHLKWIHSFSAGVDAFMKHKIAPTTLFTKTKGSMGRRMAEYCLTHILYDLKKVDYFNQLQAQKAWNQAETSDLKDQEVYILGTGNMGQSIAEFFAPLSKKVIGINTSALLKPNFSACITLETLCKISLTRAIVINVLPLTAETKGIINKSVFQNKTDLLFINIGRGASVDEADLLKALAQNQIRKAVLDVFDKEPLPAESPLWNHPRIVLTPHISGITAFEDVQKDFETAYSAITNSTTIPNIIDLSKQY